MKFSPLPHIAAIYLIIIVFSYLAVIAGKSYIYDENELIENLQALFLAASCGVFLLAMHGTSNPARILLISGFLFFLSLLLRELDIEKLGFSRLVTMIGSGHGRNIILLSFWLIVFASMLEQLGWHIRKMRQLLISPAGALYVLGGLCLVSGELIESLGKSFRFHEEVAEVIGTYFMFIAALYTPRILLAPAAQLKTGRSAPGMRGPKSP